MKITIKSYNPIWKIHFNKLKIELKSILIKLNPHIEHIGSTSIPNLSAKPIIDIAVGIKNKTSLDKTIKPMIKNKFIYYKVYNKDMPERRLFVGLKNNSDLNNFESIYYKNKKIPHEKINNLRLCHIHIWSKYSLDWKRHLAFRDYLKEYPEIRDEYQKLKLSLAKNNWIDGNEYNESKNDFIKKTELKALKWYSK